MKNDLDSRVAEWKPVKSTPFPFQCVHGWPLLDQEAMDAIYRFLDDQMSQSPGTTAFMEASSAQLVANRHAFLNARFTPHQEGGARVLTHMHSMYEDGGSFPARSELVEALQNLLYVPSTDGMSLYHCVLHSYTGRVCSGSAASKVKQLVENVLRLPFARQLYGVTSTSGRAPLFFLFVNVGRRLTTPSISFLVQGRVR
jgi:hypothetical protein